MTKTDIAWPEMGITPDVEDGPVDEWVRDSFRRKVLYTFHSMTESAYIAVTALLTITVIGISDFLGVISVTASDMTFSIILFSSALVVAVDAVVARFYQSIVHTISFKLSYWTLLIGIYLYAYIKGNSVSRSRILTVLSSSVVEYIPAIGLRKKLDRTLRPRF